MTLFEKGFSGNGLSKDPFFMHRAMAPGLSKTDS